MSVVGGLVRDALLGHPDRGDIDIVVEGDATAVAARIGVLLNARVMTHDRFGTAVVELPHEGWIDLVTARHERYERPGALPDVTPGTLADDLARRDFTINAIAFRLNGPSEGAVVDPHDGRSDLDAGLVRVLHPGSFRDDPSRVLRGLRYAARFGFSLERATAEWATESAPTLDYTSTRVAEELRRVLNEGQAASALDMAARLGVPWVVEDASALRGRFAVLDDVLALPGAPDIPKWALRLGLAVREDVLGEVAIDKWARGIAQSTARGPELAARLEHVTRPSELDEVLHGAPPAAAVAACVHGARSVAVWWQAIRDVRAEVTGADLVAAGIEPGPVVGRTLAWLRARALDGEVGGSHDEQLAASLEHARRS